ncbi:SBBP repeat-containing protein [Nannocystis punicea]|uniref:SBBP repeat-containing protein n=1 Tax=Nannocystis punicea TaxID=2995304 RepID=A0ABY7GRZ5_9BACT|nr:SBBP repeat-containing protein [Nannocystis poenicansa]WAS89730.1 SBBP repeat-containing protein [Nannocystis poenicansa]
MAVLAVAPVTVYAAPTLQFGTYKGGTEVDVDPDVDFDSNLQIAVAGTTFSSADIAKSGGFDTVLGGAQDGFVVQYDTAGGLNWGTYYGGAGLDGFVAIAHNSSDQIYAGGFTESASGVALAGAGPVHQMSLGGDADGLLVKFSNAGTPLWGTYFGGAGEDQIEGVCVGSDGSVFVTGYTQSSSGIAHSASHHGSLSSSIDAFIAKFTSSGTLSWATYYGGTDGETGGFACAVDSSGNVIVVGTTFASNGIANSGWDSAYSGGRDGFVAKLSSSGTWLWGTYYGGTGLETLLSVAVDSSDNIYIVGNTNSGNTGNVIAGGTGAFDTTPNGGTDAFFAKFTSAGTRSWGSYYGGSGGDGFDGISVQGTDVFLTGWTNSTSGIATAGSLDTTYNGGFLDAMMVLTSTSGGTPWYGQYIGGPGDDSADNIVGLSTGEVVVVGETDSTSGIATTGAADTSFGGAIDVFLQHFEMWPM